MIGWWGSLTLLTAARLDEFIILSSARGSQIRLACRTFFLTAATAKPKGQRELEFRRNSKIPSLQKFRNCERSEAISFKIPSKIPRPVLCHPPA